MFNRVLGLMLLFPCLVLAQAQDDTALAKQVVEETQVRRGLCVLLGVTDPGLPLSIASQGKFLVYAIAQEPALVQPLRQAIAQKNNTGRIMVAWHDLKKIPLADQLINLMVIRDVKTVKERGLELAEVKRLLAPNGVVWVGALGKQDEKTLRTQMTTAGLQNIKTFTDGTLRAIGSGSVPEGSDEWTHHHYGPGGNKVSQDIKMDPPQRLSWIGGVPWKMADYKPKGMVIGGHRVFHVFNESSIRKRSWLYLTARDAANGLVLWKQKAERFNPLCMAVEGDRLYTLAKDGSLVAQDGDTGKILKTYPVHPRCILIQKGILLCSDKTLTCLDAASGAVKWKSKWVVEPKSLPNAVIDGDKVIFWDLATRSLGSLRLDSGEELWSRSIAEDLGKAGKSVELCSYQNGVMILGGGEAGIYAFSANEGKHLWSHRYEKIGTPSRRKAKSYKDGFFVDGLYWTLVGDLDPNQKEKYKYSRGRIFAWKGLDPQTGKIKRTIPYPKGIGAGASCYRDQATERFLMGAYTDIFDVKTGRHYPRSTGVRASCAIGARVAYGRMYNCALYTPDRYLQGDMALVGGVTPPDETDRLQKGTAVESDSAAPASQEDWPSFRHDAARTNRASTTIASDLKSVWQQNLGGKLSPLTVADGKVFVSVVDRQQVVALDTEKGTEVWRFHAGGRVVLPPTFFKGRCLFGANDGWVYCLSSAKGTLVWRYRAAPAQRLIVGHGRIESPWPVSGGIAVQKGVAYFAVGRHADVDGGVHLMALDAATGALAWKKKLPNSAQTLNMPLLSENSISVFDSSARFPLDGTAKKVLRPAFPGSAYFPNVIDPSYIIGKKNLGERAPPRALVSVKLKAMIRAGELAIVAGYPASNESEPGIQWKPSRSSFIFADKPDKHPLEQTEQAEQAGATLWVFSIDEGKVLQKIALEAAPTFDGLAAARGKLYLADRAGRISCYGK